MSVSFPLTWSNHGTSLKDRVVSLTSEHYSRFVVSHVYDVIYMLAHRPLIFWALTRALWRWTDNETSSLIRYIPRGFYFQQPSFPFSSVDATSMRRLRRQRARPKITNMALLPHSAWSYCPRTTVLFLTLVLLWEIPSFAFCTSSSSSSAWGSSASVSTNNKHPHSLAAPSMDSRTPLSGGDSHTAASKDSLSQSNNKRPRIETSLHSIPPPQSSSSSSPSPSYGDNNSGPYQTPYNYNNINNNNHDNSNNADNQMPLYDAPTVEAGKLEELKQREAELSYQLAQIRREKLSAIRSRPLTIGVVGFGRFGQFIARTFAKYGRVVVTSRSDYSEIANGMGVTYVPLANPEAFLAQELDVIVFAVSILSFKSTIQSFVPYLQKHIHANAGKGSRRAASLHGPLVVDVLSVKEHARSVMLDLLPPECDILCTHPMFGPDSGKDGWHNLNFVYEKTRIDNVVLDPEATAARNPYGHQTDRFVDNTGTVHSLHEDSEAHVEGMDRMERFLSIWEEEGCKMVPLSCSAHDAYAANSQFITHLVGRVLGNQGLSATPIDTSGFESVLKLVDSTTADSFDLFYGLYKYNQNSADTIKQLQTAMEDVVIKLQVKEREEQGKETAKAFYEQGRREHS